LKGLILCGGIDKNLVPITYSIPKHLIPVGNKPLLVYTVELLLRSGIDHLGILVNEFSKPIFERVLRKYFNQDFYYIIQNEPFGIAHGLLLAEEFIKEEKFVMVLGDNYFDLDLINIITSFQSEEINCKIFLKEVEEPERYRVAYIGDGKIIDLVEKTKMAFSNLAITGLYALDHSIFKACKKIKPSQRGQYEITDAIKWLLQNGYSVRYEKLSGNWRDIDNPTDLINQNIDILFSIEENVMGEVINSNVTGKIILNKGSAIYNSTVRGPIIVGEDTIIKNSYIGPYTSIGNRVNIDRCNLENSIILDGCKIIGVDDPIDSSIIGEGSVIWGSKGIKKAHKFIIGKNSKIYLAT